MNISALRIALIVQDRGSIAGAARVLNLDPSSVSRAIAGLEDDIGIRIFQRSTRRLTVTEEGREFLARIAPLIEDLEAARDAARGQRGAPTGELRVTASVAFAQQVILPLLPGFQDRYPDITIDLQATDANLDLVENGIDIAIRLAPAPKGDLISTVLMPTRYHLVAAPTYLDDKLPVGAPEDLTELNCIKFALPGLSGPWMFRKDKSDPQQIAVSGSLKISNPLALREAVRIGLGVGLLADWLVVEDLREGRLKRLLPQYSWTASTFDTAAWVLYPNRRHLPGKVRAMIDYLRANLGGRAG